MMCPEVEYDTENQKIGTGKSDKVKGAGYDNALVTDIKIE